jgi:hypothetical protein
MGGLRLLFELFYACCFFFAAGGRPAGSNAKGRVGQPEDRHGRKRVRGRSRSGAGSGALQRQRQRARSGALLRSIVGR